MGTEARQRGPVTIIEPEDQKHIHPDMDASEVAMSNLEAEISQTEGLAVTINKVIGKPNDPMGYCFKQPASNFPTLDDLKEYVQRHYGEGNYRAFYRIGNRIKYNIPFSVSADLVKGGPALAAPLPTSSDPAIAQALKILGDQLAALNAKVSQPAVQADPFEQIDRLASVMQKLNPNGAPAVAGSPKSFIDSLREFREIQEFLGDGGKIESDPAPWWIPLAQDTIKALAPAAAGVVALVANRNNAAMRQPVRDVTPVNPAPAISAPQENAPMDLTQRFIAQLTPIKSNLDQIDSAAVMGQDPAKIAEFVAEQVPDTDITTFLDVIAPANRQHTLAALQSLVPGSDARTEWWNKFLDAAHAYLTEPLENEDTVPGAADGPAPVPPAGG